MKLCSQSLALTNQNNQEREHVQNTNQCNPQNGPNKQQYKTLKKPRLRERTDRAWFSRFLRHPVRKQSYTYNPGARTGQLNTIKQSTNSVVYIETQTTRCYWLENKNSAIDKKSFNTNKKDRY